MAASVDGPAPYAVIGAGIVGAATALTLCREGCRVLVLDPDEPGSGASFGNAGCLNASSVAPVALPGMLRRVPGWLLDPEGPLVLRWRYLPRIAPWLWQLVRSSTPEKVRRQSRALHSLVDQSVERTRALALGTGAESFLQQAGHLVVYRSRADFDGDAQGMALRDACGIPSEIWNARRLREAEPNLSQEYVIGRFFPENGHCSDPGRFVKRLVAACRALGTAFVRRAVRDFAIADGRVTAVRTEQGTVHPVAGVVIAAGAHSGRLAARLGDRIPLDTERGYHLMVSDAGAGPHAIPTMAAESKIVATPMQDGLRLAGTVELAGIRAPPDWRRVELLARQLRRMYPAIPANAPVTSRWMGLRPSLPDSLPVIGRARRASNAVYAFGHGHVGFAAGAASGRIAADVLLDRPCALDLEPFSPGRFQRG